MNKVTFLDVEGVHISSTASLLIFDFLSWCHVRNYSNILDTQRVFAFYLSGHLNENYQKIDRMAIAYLESSFSRW